LWIKGKAVLPFDIEKFASEIVAKTKLKSERALELACRANGWATKKTGRLRKGQTGSDITLKEGQVDYAPEIRQQIKLDFCSLSFMWGFFRFLRPPILRQKKWRC